MESRAGTKMAEEVGVEPTEDAWRLPPGLKSGHPTGDVYLPSCYFAPKMSFAFTAASRGTYGAVLPTTSSYSGRILRADRRFDGSRHRQNQDRSICRALLGEPICFHPGKCAYQSSLAVIDMAGCGDKHGMVTLGGVSDARW